MAMAGVGLTGVSLTEAYVMRALHKEKMKKQKVAEDAGLVAADNGKKIPEGCFSWVSKKSHSAKISSADVDRKLQVDDKWDFKS